MEIRLLEGPSVYRLVPVAKVEVAVGRTRTWHGSRTQGDAAIVHLAREVPARDWPDPVADLVAWVRRLRADHGEGTGSMAVHRASDAGRWVVTWPWSGYERTRLVAEAAADLVARSASPGRHVRLTGTQDRLLAAWEGRIDGAGTTPPAWIRDGDRTMPAISITGTNGKSTVTRLVTHILLGAGRHVGTTTSDGVLVDERIVDPGDWTGPGGAAAILRRSDVDVAVLETARGGLVGRGMGYESNDASILTNISSDHLDLGGIHTLAELAEVKATVCRITRPGGRVVLNLDDPLAASVARRVRAEVAWFTLRPEAPDVQRRIRGGARLYTLRRGAMVEHADGETRPIVAVADVPVTLGGLARHNVANALAAAAGARAMGATLEQVADGLRDFRPSAELSPGRLNVFLLGRRVVIIDFAHNEAGTSAILEVAQAVAGGAAGRAAPVTAIIGTAGDRPDDTLRGIGRIAATLAQRVAIKETRSYLRGRPPEAVIDTLRAGIAEAGVDPATVPVYETEPAALEAETVGAGAIAGGDGRADASRVVVLFCHEARDEVFALLARLGARPLEGLDGLRELAPRVADHR